MYATTMFEIYIFQDILRGRPHTEQLEIKRLFFAKGTNMICRPSHTYTYVCAISWL